MYQTHKAVVGTREGARFVVQFTATVHRPERGKGPRPPFIRAETPAMIKPVHGHYRPTTMGRVLADVMAGKLHIFSSTLPRKPTTRIGG